MAGVDRGGRVFAGLAGEAFGFASGVGELGANVGEFDVEAGVFAPGVGEGGVEGACFGAQPGVLVLEDGDPVDLAAAEGSLPLCRGHRHMRRVPGVSNGGCR